MISFTQFCAGISAAIVVKLASSIDDVLWLSAFLTPSLSEKERGRNALTYGFVCLFQTCLAYLISKFGQVAMDAMMGDDDDDDESNSHMSSDRVLTLLSGSALFIYSIILGVEYYKELCEEDAEYTEVRFVSTSDSSSDTTNDSSGGLDDGESARTAVLGAGPPIDEVIAATVDNTDDIVPLDVEIAGIGNGVVVPMEIDDNGDNDQTDTCTTSKPEPVSDKKSQSLAVIAFLGSLDDLTLFVPMLVGKTFGIIELIIGAMISTLAIVVICIFLTRCQLVADTLEKVPLVAIVSAFCVVLLTKGIFFMV